MVDYLTNIIGKVAGFIASNILPISSFATSIATFLITYLNYREGKATLEVTQIGRAKSSILIKPDRPDRKNPDVYWDSEYRVLSEVIITNKSSKPISIIEFKLNDNFIFNGYTKPGECYKVTTKPTKYKSTPSISIEGVEECATFPISDNWLKPVLTIPPHTSTRGYLFFNIKSDTSDVRIGKNDLTIITSRKDFKAELEIFEKCNSVLPPVK